MFGAIKLQFSSILQLYSSANKVMLSMTMNNCIYIFTCCEINVFEPQPTRWEVTIMLFGKL